MDLTCQHKFTVICHFLLSPWRDRYVAWLLAASTASISAARSPDFSSWCTPVIVVPPGEQTLSFNWAGCLSDSSTILDVPCHTGGYILFNGLMASLCKHYDHYQPHARDVFKDSKSEAKARLLRGQDQCQDHITPRPSRTSLRPNSIHCNSCWNCSTWINSVTRDSKYTYWKNMWASTRDAGSLFLCRTPTPENLGLQTLDSDSGPKIRLWLQV